MPEMHPLDELVEVVAKAYYLTPQTLRSKNRRARYREARKVFYYIARKNTNLTFDDIAQALNRSNPYSPMKQHREMAELIKSDQRLRRMVEICEYYWQSGEEPQPVPIVVKPTGEADDGRTRNSEREINQSNDGGASPD